MGIIVKDYAGVGFKDNVVQVIDEKQDVSVKLEIQSNGAGQFQFRFSNGSRWDGDHFFGRFTLLTENDESLGYGGAAKGLNASYGKGTVVKYSHLVSFQLPETHAKAFRRIRYEFGHIDHKDDGKFWKSVAQVAMYFYGGSEGALGIVPIGDTSVLSPINLGNG